MPSANATTPLQKKKNPSDPNAEDIDQQLVKLASSNGFLRGPFILYLSGELTWREALETMVVILTKEFCDQRELMVEVISGQAPSLSSHQPIALLLHDIQKKKKRKKRKRSKRHYPKWTFWEI